MSQKDRLLKIKYIGYCWAKQPIEHLSTQSFVNFAKFQLCMNTNTLMKDPIWDEYSDEELLAEFFAHIYAKDEESANELKAEVTGEKVSDDEWIEWADSQMAPAPEEYEDSLEFTPDSLGE